MEARKTNFLLFLLAIWAAKFCLSQDQVTSGYVSSVYDGGQFQIEIPSPSSTPQKISASLYAVFSPDRRTSEGSAARVYLRDLIFKKQIRIRIVEMKDSLKASVIAFLQNGENINELILKNGIGFFDNYDTYVNRSRYQTLENEARSKKVGIWAIANLHIPEELAPFKALKTLKGKVISVYDGDTMTLENNGKTTVRFYGIDCPERDQESGVKARDFARSLILNKQVTVDVADVDKYGRTVGIIKTEGGLVVNEEMLKNGWAWHYKQYSKFPEWQALEDLARAQKKGIWSLATPPQAPWEYRREFKKGNRLLQAQSGTFATDPNIEEFEGVVISVADGDTFTVLHNNEKKRLRLYGIDSPERNQPGGDLAKTYADQLVKGKIVKVHVKTTDKYKRRVAVVYLPGGEVYNEMALENGFAWHYGRYSNDESYAQLESSARNKNLGLWGLPEKPIAPWDWRRGVRN